RREAVDLAGCVAQRPAHLPRQLLGDPRLTFHEAIDAGADDPASFGQRRGAPTGLRGSRKSELVGDLLRRRQVAPQELAAIDRADGNLLRRHLKLKWPRNSAPAPSPSHDDGTGAL